MKVVLALALICLGFAAAAPQKDVQFPGQVKRNTKVTLRFSLEHDLLLLPPIFLCAMKGWREQ